MTRHFGHRFRVLHCCTDQIMSEALAQMDLTAAQGHVMGFLIHQSSPPCALDIAEAFQLSHPTVSGILKRLESKGFIELRPDQFDRRCKRIHILEKGQLFEQMIAKSIRDIEQRIVRDFTEEEQVEFIGYLDRAIANMGGSSCRLNRKEEEANND